jgi:hypothetical protein
VLRHRQKLLLLQRVGLTAEFMPSAARLLPPNPAIACTIWDAESVAANCAPGSLMDGLAATVKSPACSSDPARVATLERQVIGSDYLFLICKNVGNPT